MAEVVEQADLLLAVAPHRVVLGQPVDQLAHARAKLEREVRRRGPDEGVDVVDVVVGSAIAGASLTTSFERMRRPTTVEVMLLSAIGLWALNLTFSRYILTHGFQPLAYSTVRYGLASLVFIVIVARRRALVPDGAARPPSSSSRAAASSGSTRSASSTR